MITIFLSLISAGLLFYVVYPIFGLKNSNRFPEEDQVESKTSGLVRAKNEILAALKEIDFEHQMGKISTSDYEPLKKEYERKAIRLFKRIDDGHQPEGQPDAKIRINQGNPRGESETSERSPEGHCPSCQAAIDPLDRYCRRCGIIINPEEVS